MESNSHKTKLVSNYTMENTCDPLVSNYTMENTCDPLMDNQSHPAKLI